MAVSDLLKNYLFSLAQDRLEEVQQKWLLMTGILEAVANEEILVTYMRHFWSSSNGPTREKALYGGIKQRITSKQSVIDFAEDLYRNSSLYAAILNPSQELWDTYGPTTREYMSTLNLLGMEQMRPLIMAVLDNFSPVEVRLSLKVMVSWGVRFLIVGGFFGGGMGDFYSQKAVEIRKGIRTTVRYLL